MIEFTRRQPEPPELVAYRVANPNAGAEDFKSPGFQAVKSSVKQKLNADQYGLCAYCESTLLPDDGHIDHVKAQSSHPHLIFAYDNYVHSCIHPEHCGQAKGAKKIFIEPGPVDCNRAYSLSTNGSIGLVDHGLNPQERYEAGKTISRLRLDYSALRVEREKWVNSSITLLRTSKADFEAFIADKPFRFILRRLTA